MKKVRLLYIESNRDGTIGGSYYSLLYLIEGLDKNIYEPIVMFFQENPLISRFEKSASKVIVFDHQSPSGGYLLTFDDYLKFFPRFIRDILIGHKALIEMLNEIKPDIVHLNNSYTVNHDWVLACKRNGTKIIAHDRGARPPVSFQTKFFAKFLDAIICVSDTYLKYVTEQGLKPKIACRVYNGLDIHQYDGLYSPDLRKKTRLELGVDEDDILVGMVGNIIPWKGQIVFIKAIEKVLQKHSNVKAVLVGNTPKASKDYEDQIRSYISTNRLNKNIFLTGYRKDIPALLDAFDIFTHASIEPEPFGRVIIEAMAIKKPIIATNIGGPAEIIIDGQSGILVPTNDEIAMANAIQNYILDIPRSRQFGINAWLRLKNNFSIQQMVDGIEAVYTKVLL